MKNFEKHLKLKDYNGTITIGPMGVGKTVTLMIFVLYLKYVLRYNVIYYNFVFKETYGVDVDILTEMFIMIYRATNKNKVLLKQATSIFSRINEKIPFQHVLKFFCDLFKISNVVIIYV